MLGLPLFAAALYYQKIKVANPGADITFTGHSLGAGLASVMSVWFNRPASVFADAPFELTALNPLMMGYVAGYLAINGYSDPEFTNFIPLYAGYYGTREAQVTNYYVKGELLSVGLLGSLPKVVGNNLMIDIGGGDTLGSTTLHSIALHAALLMENKLRLDTLALPNLLPAIFDTSLYAKAPESEKADFLIQLVNSRVATLGGTSPSPDPLARFATEAPAPFVKTGFSLL